MPKGVKLVRLNAQVKRGLTHVLRLLVDDFDNGFERLLPDQDGKVIDEVTAAMEWLEQYAYDIYE